MLITQSNPPITSGESGTLYTGNGTYADMQKALRRQKEAAKKSGHAAKHIAVYSERRSAWWMFVCTVPTQKRRYTSADVMRNIVKQFSVAPAVNTAEGAVSELENKEVDKKEMRQSVIKALTDFVIRASKKGATTAEVAVLPEVAKVTLEAMDKYSTL